MNLSLIIGGVIVVIILYIIWGYFFTTTQVLMSFQKADTQTIVRGNSISQSGRNVYSFSLWTYIDDWGQNYGQEKNILEVTGSVGGSNSGELKVFQLAFDKTRNDLLIYVSGVQTIATSPTCSITNFPLQSWVNIGVSVYGRAVDVYIDGKLVKTCSLDSVAALINKSDTIFIGGSPIGASPGFSGFIASVVYTPYQISPQDAWDTYARGYNNSTFGLGNLFQRYKMQLAFIKDNSVISSVTI
jgi:hypothetical protein